jgi:ethanolamine ammonia-lyase large subunit
MPQFARPSADTLRDNWFDEAAGTTNIFTHIDEASADDNDFVKTQLTPTADVYVTKLSAVSDPVSSANHIVRFRYRKEATSGEQIDLTVQLRQGYTNEGAQGTLIATVATLVDITGAAWTQVAYTLAGAEADAITNYADLYLRFVGNKV